MYSDVLFVSDILLDKVLFLIEAQKITQIMRYFISMGHRPVMRGQQSDEKFDKHKGT